MTELKYTVSEDDIKALNTGIMLRYVLLYGIVAAVGLAVGIVAVVINPQTMMFVLGIMLIVLGGALLVCALLLLIAPKNYVLSIVPTNVEYTVCIDKDIRINAADGADGNNATLNFSQVTGVKRKNVGIVLSVGKAGVFVIKSESDVLFNELKEKQGKLLISEAEPDADKPVLSETTPETTEDIPAKEPVVPSENAENDPAEN